MLEPGACQRLPSLVAPRPRPEAPDAAARAAKKLRKSLPIQIADEQPGWAELLARVFGTGGFACAHCGVPWPSDV
jgi:hypothetical protein